MKKIKKYSVVIPAKNESRTLKCLIPKLKENDYVETIIVVNDGSVDDTVNVCKDNDICFITHKVSLGNGAAVKSGLRRVESENVILLDADGQHNPEEIYNLINKFEMGFDMIVGARRSKDHATAFRRLANYVYNKLSSWVVGHKVEDLTSGFRVANTEKLKEFIELYPNGFSYPTTSTIAFFRAGYSVGYENINVKKRYGKSHIKIYQDGIKFLLIIFKVCTLYSPLKIFFPLSVMHIMLGVLYYLYTYWTQNAFTNMGVLLIGNGVLIFLVGLVSEQITSMMYRKR
ncbi:glycosyltransferase family 2 protein [Zooshikella marina]|uniref:glycosyltransferase family 2 protein n=1 Tax=Zooshikella ganghwensis TaxID=202772 RepID=UPI001BB05EC8|nr:glycosyltransferase family 2 protein [Zooshikella ganghwensis]MBU2707301.1 glycosyltransferase family 2 protein [Zooshikella ganghwensis]